MTRQQRRERRREERRSVRAWSRPGWATRRRGLIIGGLVGVVVVALVAVGLIQQASTSRNFTFTPYQGHESPGVSATGGTFDEVLSQGKPVVLNFWGGNCPPCRAEMPDLQTVSEHYGDDVIFLGLDVGPFLGLGTREQAASLLRELRVTYPAAYPNDGGTIRAFGVTSLPQTVFYDAGGEQVRNWSGVLTAGRLNAIVRDDLGVVATEG